jgi:hypothetical protein
MDRSLNLGLLREALSVHDALPSAEELQRLLAEAEVALFAQQPRVPEDLLATAWYLHGAASSDPQFEIYSVERQRRAFQVSAHVFDLALSERDRPPAEQFRLSFAAQIGYRRGELDPNATAIYNSALSLLAADAPLLNHAETIALEAGVAFLGFQSRDLFPLLRRWRSDLGALRRRLDVETLEPTVFGPAAGVVEGAWQLLRFLVFGSEAALTAARTILEAALAPPSGLDDLDARWVAAHLRRLADDIDEGSLWRVLPPDVPSAARQALTLSPPAVLTLWRPQLQLLLQDTEHSVMAPETRRLVLSVPTSAGKTLMAQLFILSHLATSFGSVCYVSPMRGLGRELRRTMTARLRIMEKELGPDYPDWYLDLFGPEDLEEVRPDLDVMTPERLLNLLRHDAEALLDRFSMFVFDEAQMLGERGRGFVLEQALSFVHWRTRNEHHRILLLSAALGNRGQIAQWLSNSDGPARLFESDWRGPRRLHALFGTSIEWEPEYERREAVQSTTNPWRVRHPLIGVIRLRPAHAGAPTRLALTEPVGEIAFRESSPGSRVGGRESSASTPFYKMVAQLVAVVGRAGPVLTVTSTRADATRMAKAVADLHPRSQATALLSSFVERRLGSEHPLAHVVPHGVAFHHAALPTDVLEAIEDAFRTGVIRHVACTSTLTEGVNLPARTVIVAETRYPGQPEDALLAGGRLVNAIGRAGRAGKETEGWVILTRQAAESITDFDLLSPTDEELNVESRLADDAALAALAEYEVRVAEGEDAVFSAAAREIDGFISFVWFLLASEEAQANAPAEADVAAALEATLAFHQLPTQHRSRWMRVAEDVRASYATAPPESRRRWAEAGTSVDSARQLELLAVELAEHAAARTDRDQLDTALEVLADIEVLSRLFTLPEAPRQWRFKRSRGGPVRAISVSPDALLRAWIEGRTPSDMSSTYLADVPARDFAVEQIVDATAELFEHYASWTLASVIEQANRLLEGEPPFCRALPMYVRYGVDSTLAVELLTRGVRSRALAVAVSAAAVAAEIEATAVADWLGDMSIAAWRDRFDATAGDVVDLLELTRSGRAGVVRELLENGEARIEEPTAPEERPVEIRALGAVGLPGPLGVFRRGTDDQAGVVPPRYHADVQALLETGVVASVTLGEDGLRFSADAET